MSIAAMLAVGNSLRHASHEDGNRHAWILMLILQLPFILYFMFTSWRQLQKVRAILIAQGVP